MQATDQQFNQAKYCIMQDGPHLNAIICPITPFTLRLPCCEWNANKSNAVDDDPFQIGDNFQPGLCRQFVQQIVSPASECIPNVWPKHILTSLFLYLSTDKINLPRDHLSQHRKPSEPLQSPVLPAAIFFRRCDIFAWLNRNDEFTVGGNHRHPHQVVFAGLI